MNEIVEKIVKNSDVNIKERIIELTVQECINYLNSEIERLILYQNSLEVAEKDKIADVDFAVMKCEDNIAGIKHHFGMTD